jgi:uncharacterized protein (DUF433 family)
MAERLNLQVNTRLSARDKHELDLVASARAQKPLALARELLREGIRRERHPGVTFRSGSAGRRAALEGRRLDVWQVMETVWASEGDVEAAAEYLGIPPADVRVAVGYCADYPEEVEEMTRGNQEMAARAEAQFRRERRALTR